MSSLSARGLSGLPEIAAGTDLGELIVAAIDAEPAMSPLADGQIVAIAHKAVSKAEGAVVDLRKSAMPRARARGIASEQQKDPRVVQVVLDQSEEVLREANGVLICRTHHGFVCANAGVDASNSADTNTLIVLPHDPDASARTDPKAFARADGCECGRTDQR